jgi:ribosomal protein L44E
MSDYFFPLVSSKSLATRCVPNWQSLSSEWWWQPFCYSRRRWIINLKAIDNLKVWTGEKKKSRRKSRIQNSWTRKPNQRSKTTETTVLFFRCMLCQISSATRARTCRSSRCRVIVIELGSFCILAQQDGNLYKRLDTQRKLLASSMHPFSWMAQRLESYFWLLIITDVSFARAAGAVSGGGSLFSFVFL